MEQVRFGSWSSALVMQLYILELVEGSFDRPAVRRAILSKVFLGGKEEPWLAG